METILAIGLAVVVAGGVIHFVRKEGAPSSNGNKTEFDSTKVLNFQDIKDMKVERVDFLNFEDIVKWFKAFGLRKGSDIPFVITKVSLIADRLPLPVTENGVASVEGCSSIILGVFDNDKGQIKASNFVYYKETDEKTKDMFAHSENGIVVLA